MILLEGGKNALEGGKNALLHRVLIESIFLFLNVFLNIEGGIISNGYI